MATTSQSALVLATIDLASISFYTAVVTALPSWPFPAASWPDPPSDGSLLLQWQCRRACVVSMIEVTR